LLIGHPLQVLTKEHLVGQLDARRRQRLGPSIAQRLGPLRP
jgi:hypothetical protein